MSTYRSTSYVRSSQRKSGSNQVELKLNFDGLCDTDTAKQVAKLLFDTYDKNQDGKIEGKEVDNMITDTYKIFNKQFLPTETDTNVYTTVLDVNKDKRVNLDDLEKLCIKYLVQGKLTKVETVKKRVYTAEVEARLEVARRLFRSIDDDQSGFIGEEEVPQLLIETYKTMGVNNYNPTQEDVKAWMSLTDLDEDGKVTLEDYEDFVVRSLKNAGFKVEKDAFSF